MTFATLNVTGASASLTVNGSVGVSSPNHSVPITPSMTAEQVAGAVQQALANQLGGGQTSLFPTSGDLVRVIRRTVSSPGPLILTTGLAGDIGNASTTAGAQNNSVEGVYIDDIIIGFAERGEIITGAQANQNFITNPRYNGLDLSTGEYDLEIRRGAEFGTSVGTANVLNRGIDTNDREVGGATLTVPGAAAISNGSTIVISDGVNSVTFQFIDQKGSLTATPGAFAISFNPASGPAGNHQPETAAVLASRLRDAINSPAVQGTLKVKAGSADGFDSGTAGTSARLHTQEI